MNKQKLLEKLKNKEYRDAFVSELIDTGVPFQIRALRKQRKWTQKALGERSVMHQETISRYEDPNYGDLNLKTLKRLASAFDCGLVVRFVPLSDLVKWELSLSSTSLEVLSYNEELYFKEAVTTSELANATSSPISPIEKRVAKELLPPPSFLPRMINTSSAISAPITP